MKVLLLFIVTLISGFSYAQGSGDLDILFGIDTIGETDGPGKVLIQHNLGGVASSESGTVIYNYLDGTGSMLVGGYVYRDNSGIDDVDMVVTKLNYDGTIDINFGDFGHATVWFDLGTDKQDFLHDIQVDKVSGHIYLIGSASTSIPGDTDFAIARLTSAGILDTGFSGDGKLTIAFDLGGDKSDQAYSAFLSFGSLYVAGYATATVGSDFAITKVDVNAGTIDQSFGNNGKLTIDFPGSSNSNDVALRIYPLREGHSDTIWVLGRQSQSNGAHAPALAFIDHLGDLQTQFSSDGKFVYPETRVGVTIADAIKHPTKANEFLFVGKDTHPNVFPVQNHDCAVSYINVTSFSQPIGDSFNFKLDVNEGTFLELNSECKSATFGFNGKLILAGSLYSASPNIEWKMALMQFSSFDVNSGSNSIGIDLGFGIDGKKQFNFTDIMAPPRTGQIVDIISNVIYDGGQKILAVGTATNQIGDRKIAVARLISAGSSYPSVSLTSPAHASVVSFGSTVTFIGEAFDNEDGDISSAIVWSSSIDGQLGIGSLITRNNLTVGLHTISATVWDSNGQSDVSQIALFVDDIIFKNGFE